MQHYDMLTIYHARGTRAIRPIWLCLELGLEYRMVNVDFTPEYLASGSWRAISPAGKLPVLQDGELTMFESGAMMDYLLAVYGEGRLRPATDTIDFGLHQQWSWFAEATLARPLGANRILRANKSSQNKLRADALAKIENALYVVEQALMGKSYLLGSFTSADIMMGYTLELLRGLDLLDERFLESNRYLESLKLRPACETAFAA